jgi:hypothetical protein
MFHHFSAGNDVFFLFSVSLKTNLIAHPFLILLDYLYLFVKKGHHMNTLKKYRIYKICQQGVQLNDTFSFNKSLIYDMIINVPNSYNSTYIYYSLLIHICFQLHHTHPQTFLLMHQPGLLLFTNLSLWTYSTTSVCTNSTTAPTIITSLQKFKPDFNTFYSSTSNHIYFMLLHY